jgi:hypothetical protein
VVFPVWPQGSIGPLVQGAGLEPALPCGKGIPSGEIGGDGSTIHLADPASVERIQPVIESRYRDRFGQPLSVRVHYTSDGAAEVGYAARATVRPK